MSPHRSKPLEWIAGAIGTVIAAPGVVWLVRLVRAMRAASAPRPAAECSWTREEKRRIMAALERNEGHQEQHAQVDLLIADISRVLREQADWNADMQSWRDQVPDSTTPPKAQ